MIQGTQNKSVTAFAPILAATSSRDAWSQCLPNTGRLCRNDEDLIRSMMDHRRLAWTGYMDAELMSHAVRRGRVLPTLMRRVVPQAYQGHKTHAAPS